MKDQENTYEQIMRKIANLVAPNSQSFPKSFFVKFDFYKARELELWELSAMFQLTTRQAVIVFRKLDPRFGQIVAMETFVKELNEYLTMNKI